MSNSELWRNFKERLVNEEMTAEEREKFNSIVTIVSDLRLKIDEMSKQLKVYHCFNELPDDARDIIKVLYDKGIYKGANADDLNLPEMLMRTLVINYRAKLYK